MQIVAHEMIYIAFVPTLLIIFTPLNFGINNVIYF